MTKFPLAALTLAAGVALTPPVSAGVIGAACMRSDRAAATSRMCGCIQNVADQVLTGSDQRTAARFFADPDRSQQVRTSDRASDTAFWARYREFGAAAESNCAAG